MPRSNSGTSPPHAPTPSPTPSQDRTSSPPAPGRSLPQRSLRVCNPCRVGKRKCDKQYPVCGRCKRLGIRCSYEVLESHHVPNNNNTSSLVPPPAWAGAPPRFEVTIPIEVDPPRSYPIQERWYMPFLFERFFQNFCMSTIACESRSIAYQMQTIYIEHSLTDPCTFHATMYAASAYLDAASDDRDNPITLYHQMQTLRLVSDRISSSSSSPPSHESQDHDMDGAIAAVIPLAFFTYIKTDLTESKAHLDGLLQMMTAKGGHNKLGLNGLLVSLISLSALVFTIVFDQPYLELSTLGWTEWPLPPPTRYISKLASDILRARSEERIPKVAHDIFHDVYDVTRSFNITTTTTATSTTHTHNWHHHHRKWIQSILNRWHVELERYRNDLDCPGLPTTTTTTTTTSTARAIEEQSQNPLDRAVFLAGLLFFYIVDDGYKEPATFATLQHRVVTELAQALTETTEAVWLNASPLLFSWVCLTGAAASQGMRQRAWFYYRQGPVFMTLINGPPCVQEVLSYYDWLRSRVMQVELQIYEDP